MEITEIRINLVGGPAERVKAFCTITLDGGFVVRDLKVIEGPGGIFLAMPSRKLADRCPRCAAKNHLRARFCNHCGARLNENRAPRDGQGRVKLHADIAHPINAECRDAIQTAVVNAFNAEVQRSGRPGYEPAADVTEEFGGVEYDEFMDALSAARAVAHSDPKLNAANPDRAPTNRSAHACRESLQLAGPSDSTNRACDQDLSSRISRPEDGGSPTHSRRAAPVATDEGDDGFGEGIL